jgi:hypothetical protein
MYLKYLNIFHKICLDLKKGIFIIIHYLNGNYERDLFKIIIFNSLLYLNNG